MCIEIISLNLMNYWRRIVLSVFIIEILKHWLLKYRDLWMDYPHKMNDVFHIQSLAPYYLRDKNELYSRNPKTVVYGTESVTIIAPKIWPIVPQEFKTSQSLYSFKKHIRKWKPNCPCRLSKTYLQHVAFI